MRRHLHVYENLHEFSRVLAYVAKVEVDVPGTHQLALMGYERLKVGHFNGRSPEVSVSLDVLAKPLGALVAGRTEHSPEGLYSVGLKVIDDQLILMLEAGVCTHMADSSRQSSPSHTHSYASSGTFFAGIDVAYASSNNAISEHGLKCGAGHAGGPTDGSVHSDGKQLGFARHGLGTPGGSRCKTLKRSHAYGIILNHGLPERAVDDICSGCLCQLAESFESDASHESHGGVPHA